MDLNARVNANFAGVDANFQKVTVTLQFSFFHFDISQHLHKIKAKYTKPFGRKGLKMLGSW